MTVKYISIIENILPQRYWIEIQGLLTHKEFPWNYYEDISLDSPGADLSELNPEIMGSCGFTHVFFHKDRQSPYWQFIKPLVYSIAEKSSFRNDLRSVEPFRVKANLQTQLNNSTVDNFNTPHIDPARDRTGKINWIFLYYVTDSDGDTIIFNETAENGVPARFTVKKRVSHKANSAVVFRDNMYHASSNPVKYRKRININFNLISS
jgi:hypothetical protein